MKLGKLFLIGATALIGFSGTAQDEDQQRECDRRRLFATTAIQNAQTPGVDDASKTKFFQEAAQNYLEAEVLCKGLDKDNWGRLIQVLQFAIDGEKDEARKFAYIDTLNSAYDRMEAAGFNNTANDLTRGYMLLQAKKPNREKADSLFQAAIKAAGAATDEWYISYAYYNAITIYPTLTGDKKTVMKKRLINDYFWFSKLVTEGNMSVRTQETLTAYLNTVVQSCDDLTPEIAGFIANLPADKEAAKSAVGNMMSLMDSKNCQDKKEYMNLVKKMIELDPTSMEALEAQAKIYESEKNWGAAIDVYEKIKSLATDDDRKQKAQLSIAIAQFNRGSYKAAHSAGMAVGGKYRNDGIKIAAKSVAATAMSCGESTFERKCNYIYAEQLMNQAGSSAYKSNGPTSGEIFENGSPKTQYLSCWGVTVNL